MSDVVPPARRGDGTDQRHIDGTDATCDASFNRGYDAGYEAGVSAATAVRFGVPPEVMLAARLLRTAARDEEQS